MNAKTWHHGLVARWWAEFNRGGPEIEYFRSFVEEGQPALDAACGTGRLLVPYLHANLDVDGCDVSRDMLELCRERAEREGLAAPRLYAQALHELDLPRRYRTIVVCGGFGLGGSRADDTEALRRFHAHLEPGGTLVLDNEVPYASATRWRAWPKDGRGEIPTPWPERGDVRRAAHGSELELASRIVALDPLAQSLRLEMRARLWRDGEILVEERHELQLTMYFAHELRLMLETAGFVGVQMRSGYTDAAPTADDDVVVLVARK